MGRLFSKKNETKPVLPDFFTIVIYVYNKSEHKNDHKTEHMDVKKVPVCEGRLFYIFDDFDFFLLNKFLVVHGLSILSLTEKCFGKSAMKSNHGKMIQKISYHRIAISEKILNV